MGNSVDRYSLAWASLASLGLVACATWWALSPRASDPTERVGTAAQPVAAAASSGGLWHSPPAGAPAPDSAPGPLAQTAAMAAAGPQPQAPAQDDVLSHGFVTASLQALSAHGLRLNQPQLSLHTVQTVDLAAAKTLSHWARTQGFSVRSPVKVLEHGGQVTWVLPIERHAVLEVAQILADGQQIRARAQQTPGARYHTWQVPVGGRSTLAGAAQS